MIDTEDLKNIRLKIEEFEKQRDFVIRSSRDIVKVSKSAIYATHRGDLASADKYIDEMKTKLKELDAVAKTNPRLIFTGSYKVAVQEYVEAVTFLEFIKNKRLPKRSELDVEVDHYLLGIFDLAGELTRKAINSVIKEDYKTALEIKDFVSELYGELMQFNFSGGELRSKFDSIKYELKKMEDLVLELKLKDKV